MPSSPTTALRNQYQQILTHGDAARPAYNYAVARLVEEIHRLGLDPWSREIIFPDGTLLKASRPPGSEPLPRQWIPVDTLRFRGEISQLPSRVEGVGAPVVEVGDISRIGHQRVRENLPVRNLTAIARCEGNRIQLDLVDPYQTETVRLGGKSQKIAADFGAALMLGLSRSRVDKLGLARLIRPSRYDDTANLNFVQPYDPQRIPVLLVHGLDSTPATFAPMYFKLLADPVIRKHYQFWVFSYPSGYPYPYSASLLRRELDEVKREFPNHKPIVIVGHSMGCLISRLMITDAGEKLWLRAFGKPPSKTPISGIGKDQLMKSLIFTDRPEIQRAVFFSGPHRGSILATNVVGRIASRLVHTPGLIADVRNAAISAATADIAGLTMSAAPNSIGTLSPRNPFVVEINRIPIVPRVPYHSIVGDRGKGDTPESSDGVVAYWSSHLQGASSEKIVPSGHGSHQHPQGIEEMRRILLLHLKP